MGSGPFNATALLHTGRSFATTDKSAAKEWASVLLKAANSISELGGAKVGDRTMMDALASAASEFQDAQNSGSNAFVTWEKATAAAKARRDATAKMKPGLGRSSYLGTRAEGIGAST